jgi:riboflavin synthase
MFTGIVQTVATVRSLVGGLLIVDPKEIPGGEPWHMGESVAISGCCLTIVGFEDGLRFDLSEETLKRTSIGDMKPGSLVNIERAMSQDERFGGHIVQGHVDATGTVLSVTKTEQAWIFRFQAPAEFDRYLIDKGSVSVDGISLTVVEPDKGAFDVWIIPHTFEVTNFQQTKPGDKVNLEFDVIAKYLEKILEPYIANLVKRTG